MGKHSHMIVEIVTPTEPMLEITGINSATYLVNEGFPVNVLNGPKCAIFEFPDNAESRESLKRYSQGCSTRHLLEIRSRLYREASAAMRGGVRYER